MTVETTFMATTHTVHKKRKIMIIFFKKTYV